MVIELRYAEGSAERLHDLTAELIRLPVAGLVTGGLAAARAAQHATSTIPIVLLGGDDPVQQGLITSLAQPGGNITALPPRGGISTRSGWRSSRRRYPTPHTSPC